MPDISKIADEASIIVNGYAFSKEENAYCRVLNLDRPEHAVVLDENGDVIETSMDDIEIQIVKDYYAKNKKYMEED